MPSPYTGSHTPVPLKEIPKPLIQATIALEDQDFYRNPGIDLRGIARAVWYNVTQQDTKMNVRWAGARSRSNSSAP